MISVAKMLLASITALSLNAYAATAHAQVMYVFGDKDHRTFLGCLTCDKFDDKSISNSYSDFGSKYSDKSILNTYSPYGDKYSDTSPCNKYADTPPVVVGPNGQFYGALSVNKYTTYASDQMRRVAQQICASSHEDNTFLED